MYDDEMLEKLPNFWAKDEDSNVAKLMRIIGEELDEIWTELMLQKTDRSVEFGSAESVRVLARNIGLYQKPGEDKEAFKQRIKSHVQGAVGGGTLEQLSFSMEQFLTKESYYMFSETDPGEFDFYYQTYGLTVDDSVVEEQINKYKAAGINVTFHDITGWTTEIDIQEDDEIAAARCGTALVGHGNIVGS